MNRVCLVLVIWPWYLNQMDGRCEGADSSRRVGNRMIEPSRFCRKFDVTDRARCAVSSIVRLLCTLTDEHRSPSPCMLNNALGLRVLSEGRSAEDASAIRSAVTGAGCRAKDLYSILSSRRYQ